MHAFLSVLAMWHIGMLLLRKEVAVWFGAHPERAGVSHTVPLPALDIPTKLLQFMISNFSVLRRTDAYR